MYLVVNLPPRQTIFDYGVSREENADL